MLRLLPGISSLLMFTFPVHSSAFFENLFPVFPILAVAITGPVWAIGRPARRYRLLMRVPVLSAHVFSRRVENRALYYFLCKILLQSCVFYKLRDLL